MRLFKTILKVLAVLLILLLAGGFLFKNSLKPTYQGELKLTSLKDKVEVFYDDYGIPHIYAQNELDARRTLGMCMLRIDYGKWKLLDVWLLVDFQNCLVKN